MSYQILSGDCRQHMREVVPAKSVHVAVTSPPYWGLRDYGIPGSDWEDGWHGVFGLEPTIEQYVAHTLEIFEGLRRVLRDDGVIFLNLGDSYSKGNMSEPVTPIDDAHAAWLACLIETDGSLYVHRQSHKDRPPSYGSHIRVAMTNPEHVEFAHRITRAGSVWKNKKKTSSGRSIYEWSVRGPDVIPILRRIRPWLILKHKQARILCALAKHVSEKKFHRVRPVTEEARERRQRWAELCGRLNAREDVDPEAPEIFPSLRAGNKCLIPHRVAIALQDAGFVVRQDIVWEKKSPMPESINGVRWQKCRVKTAVNQPSKPGSYSDVSQRYRHSSGGVVTLGGATYADCPGCPRCEAGGGYVLRRASWRPTTGHEFVFMITKGTDYFCDALGAAEPTSGTAHSRGTGVNQKCDKAVIGREKQNASFSSAVRGIVETRNPRSVWSLSSESYKGGHFAAFPSTLVHKCLSAAISGSKQCCGECGAQYAPVIEKQRVPTRPGTDSKVNGVPLHPESPYQSHNGTIAGNRDPQRHVTRTIASEYRPTCGCNAGEPVAPTVYDPFCGSGTTLQVAHWLGLNGIGSEIGEHYLPLIQERIKTRPRCLRTSKSARKIQPSQINHPTLFDMEAG